MKLLKLLLGYEAPIIDFPFAPSDVARYSSATLACTQVQASGAQLDRQTWDELQLDAYLDRVAQDSSIFGRQALHRRLQGGREVDGGDGPPGQPTAAQAYERIQALAGDKAAQGDLARACRGLRAVDAEVAGMLFGPAPERPPRWSAWLGWLPPAFLGAAAAMFFWGPAWIVTLGLWLLLMGVQAAWYMRAQAWGRLIVALQQLLRAHSLLGALPDGGAGARYAEALRPGAAAAGKASRVLGRSPLMQMIPGGREYSEWVLLDNIRHYFSSHNAFLDRIAALRDSYRLVAELEADLALARHVGAVERVCPATVAEVDSVDSADSVDSPDSGAIVLQGVVHPLVAEAQPLSFSIRGPGAFISGQNGVGKSTLLRTVGLNLVAARAFGFCYADSAVTPMLPVYASMQNEDSLADGDSLYVAELKRAQALLALAQHDSGRAVFLIDEIFRGTNHMESVSAAAAVLDTLAQRGVVIASSHHLVLAPLLSRTLSPLCVEAGSDGRLQIRDGVLAHTNGISLLSRHGFAADIEAKARRVHAWLSNHLAHPPGGAAVLAEAEVS